MAPTKTTASSSPPSSSPTLRCTSSTETSGPSWHQGYCSTGDDDYDSDDNDKDDEDDNDEYFTHRPIDETTAQDKANAVALADFYLGGTANMNEKHFANITEMFTDAFATYAVECFVSRAKTTQTVYQYFYSYNG